MPTYVYGCDEGHENEVIQRITEEVHTKCTKIVKRDGKVQPCNAPARRIPQPAGIALRGAGWFRDGYSKPKS